MKQINRRHLLLRKILTWLSLGAASFIFQACYGMPMGAYVSGTVRCSETKEPLAEIEVQVSGHRWGRYTDDDGRFYENIDESGKSTIMFKDPGGEYHDKDVTVNVSKRDIERNKDIYLDVLMDRKQ